MKMSFCLFVTAVDNASAPLHSCALVKTFLQKSLLQENMEILLRR